MGQSSVPREIRSTHRAPVIEVLQIVRVLPDVDADDRSVTKERILVGRGDYFEDLRLGVPSLQACENKVHIRANDTYEPTPARTLNGRRRGIEFLEEVLDGAKVMLDRIFEGAVLENAAVALDVFAVRGGREVLPEEGVIDVTAAVEANGRLQGDALFRGRGSGIIVLCGVESIDVRPVMLVVMQPHDLCDDVGFERIVCVREVGNDVRHDGGRAVK